jgi:hypothetical protein
MKEIFLTQGKVALVDDDDFDFLNSFNWHLKRKKGNPDYAIRHLMVLFAITEMVMVLIIRGII